MKTKMWRILALALVAGTVAGTLRLSPDSTTLATGCNPAKLTFDEEVQDAELIAIVKLLAEESATPTSMATTKPGSRSATPTVNRPTVSSPTSALRSTTTPHLPTPSPTQVSSDIAKIPPAIVVERILVANETGNAENDMTRQQQNQQRLAEILFNQKDNYGCGIANGGFRYSAGDRFVVFVRGNEPLPPYFGSVYRVRDHGVPFIARLSRAAYDRFFPGQPSGPEQDPKVLYFTVVTLDKFEGLIRYVRGNTIAPPDTGSAGLASGR